MQQTDQSEISRLHTDNNNNGPTDGSLAVAKLSLSNTFAIMIHELRDMKKTMKESATQLKQIANNISLTSLTTRSRSDSVSSPERKDKVDLFIRVSVVNVGDIDTVKQEFFCDLYLAVKWREPRLRGKLSESDIDWNAEWDPRIYFHNAVSYNMFEKKHQLEETNHQDGPLVRQSYRVKGTFKEILELNDFPFDYQRLNLILTSNWNMTLVSLSRDDLEEDNIQTWTFTGKQEWELQPHILTSISLSENEQATSPRRYPIYNITLHVKRKHNFYVFNMAFIMFLITALTFSSFIINAEEVADRLHVTLTLLLTAIAFKFAVKQHIPPVAYQTLMDKYILSCLVFLFSISVQNAVAGVIKNASTLKLFENISLYVAAGIFTLSNTIFVFISIWKVKKVYLLKNKQAKLYNSIKEKCYNESARLEGKRL